jgi:hypothetical protein
MDDPDSLVVAGGWRHPLAEGGSDECGGNQDHVAGPTAGMESARTWDPIGRAGRPESAGLARMVHFARRLLIGNLCEATASAV